MPLMNIVQAINLALRQEMERDPSVLVLGEDVGGDGGVFRVTEGLLQKFPQRVIDTPLAETAIAGCAIGLAVYGFKPVAEIQFDGFTYSALDQLINHAGRIRTRSRGRFHCPMVLRAPYSGGIHAPEHHSESPEAYYVHTPGIKVVIPSTPYEAKGLLISAIRDPDPVIFLEPKRIYRAIKEEVSEDDYAIPLGKARIAREGTDVTVFAYGAMLHVALQAAESVKDRYSIEVVDLRTLSPVDIGTVLESVKKTGRSIIVHEAPMSCGFGAELAALLSDRDIMYLKSPIVRITGFDTPMPLYKLENYYLPNADRVVSGIEKVMQF